MSLTLCGGHLPSKYESATVVVGSNPSECNDILPHLLLAFASKIGVITSMDYGLWISFLQSISIEAKKNWFAEL